MVITLIKHLFVDEAGKWIEKIPTWCLYAIMVLTGLAAWVTPDFVPFLEESIVAMVYIKIGRELIRRRGLSVEVRDPSAIDQGQK